MEALTVARRHREIMGTISAVVSLLMDNQWTPCAADKWGPDPHSPEQQGDYWDFRDDGNFAVPQAELIVQHFLDQVKARLWKGAARHEYGAGAENGISSASMRRLLRRFGSVHGTSCAGLMRAIATGGMWPRARKAAAGYRVDPLCQRCKAAPETLFHRYWACAENKGHPAYDESERYAEQAAEESELFPIFWLRGLLPLPWVQVPPPPVEEAWEGWGFQQLGPGCLGTGTFGSPVVLYGDASGGENSGSPELRRVGLAICRCDQLDPPVASAGVMGPLVKLKQTVANGEVEALRMAIFCTQGYLLYATDNEAVVLGWYCKLDCCPKGDSAAAWAGVATALGSRCRSMVSVCFVNSHLLEKFPERVN